MRYQPGIQYLLTLLVVFFQIFATIMLAVPVFSSDGSNAENRMEFQARAGSFVYHNYSGMESELNKLNQDYGGLMELDTAQDLFGLPDCRDGYKIWVVRITNESISSSKPELLYLGGHHGDEVISIEVPFYFIKWLLTNYDTDPDVRFIVDNRELYILPVINPYGWVHNTRYDGNGEDPNRDYPFGNESTNDALTTLGSRAVHELMKIHAFYGGLSFHAGAQLMYYAWGTPLHNTATDVSPDDKAFRAVGERLSSFAGSYGGKYAHGPANQIIYEAPGAWSDYAYAASWDPAGMDPVYPTEGARMVAIGVEISSQRKPPESSLGTTIDLYQSPSDVDGHIPKNIRLSYAFAELAEPYIDIIDEQKIPQAVGPGENLSLTWRVGGCVNVDQTQVLHGTSSEPVQAYSQGSPNQTGTGGFDGQEFHYDLTMPQDKGRYYFTIRARADGNYQAKVVPDPPLTPQTIYVNARTNDSYQLSIDGKTVNGKLDYFSKVVSVEVIHWHNTTLDILEYPERGVVNEQVTLKWEFIDTHEVISQSVRYAKSPDILPVLGNRITGEAIPTGGGTDLQFQIDLELPSKAGPYFYMIDALVEYNLTVYSDPFEIFVEPGFVLDNITGPVFVNDSYAVKGEVSGIEIEVNLSLQIYSESDLDDENLIEEISFLTPGAWGTYGVSLSAPEVGGKYYLRYMAEFHYNLTGTDYTFFSNIVELTVKDRIIVTIPNATYDAVNRTILISGVTAVCSNLSHGLIVHLNTVTHEFIIVNSDGEGIHIGDLEWSGTQWFARIKDLQNITNGNYHVLASFWDGNHFGESVYVANDSSEFTVFALPSRPGNENGKDDGALQLSIYQVLIPVVISVAVVILALFFKRTMSKSEDNSETGADEKKNEKGDEEVNDGSDD